MSFLPLASGRHRGRIPRRAGTPPVSVHGRHLLWLHLRGEGWYRCGAELIGPLVPHLGVMAAGEQDQSLLHGDCDVRWTLFASPAVSAVPAGVRVALEGLAVERSHARPLDAAEAARAAALFHELEDQRAAPGIEARLRASAALTALLAMWAEPARGDDHEPRVARYRALIESRCDDADASLAELAREAGLSPDHLRVLFAQRFGMTPVAYRSRLRLERARALLERTSLGVAEVARRVGFPHAAHFAKRFRAAYGVSPSDHARAAPASARRRGGDGRRA